MAGIMYPPVFAALFYFRKKRAGPKARPNGFKEFEILFCKITGEAEGYPEEPDLPVQA